MSKPRKQVRIIGLLSVESNLGLLWFYFTTVTLTNQMQSQNRSRLGQMRFPALGAGYVYLLRVLIGSLRCLRLL